MHTCRVKLHCTHTTILRLSRSCLGQPGSADTGRNIHPLTPIMVINYPLFASSIYYDLWPPLCSIYVPDSLFPQSLSKFSLVYLLAWHPPLHTPYISSPNHCLLFAAHAHTIALASEKYGCFTLSAMDDLIPLSIWCDSPTNGSFAFLGMTTCGDCHWIMACSALTS